MSPRRAPKILARSGVVRPERAFGPVSAAAFLLVAWEAVAHASGSGWVQGLGAVAAGIVVVGMLGPLGSLSRLSVCIETAPTDGRSGEPLVVVVVATRACRVSPGRPTGGPVFATPGEPTRIELRPDRRGVLEAVNLQVASAAPLGMLWWSSRLRVPLPHPVAVAPARLPAEASLSAGTGTRSAGGGQQPQPFGTLRSVREYRRGDSPRQVHWRASAHTGGLMVRESELDADRPVHLVVELPDDEAAAERTASEAMGAVFELLGRRQTVILETDEDGRRVSAPVTSELDAGRRLARAGRNPWADPPPPRPRNARR